MADLYSIRHIALVYALRGRSRAEIATIDRIMKPFDTALNPLYKKQQMPERKVTHKQLVAYMKKFRSFMRDTHSGMNQRLRSMDQKLLEPQDIMLAFTDSDDRVVCFVTGDGRVHTFKPQEGPRLEQISSLRPHWSSF